MLLWMFASRYFISYIVLSDLSKIIPYIRILQFYLIEGSYEENAESSATFKVRWRWLVKSNKICALLPQSFVFSALSISRLYSSQRETASPQAASPPPNCIPFWARIVMQFCGGSEIEVQTGIYKYNMWLAIVKRLFVSCEVFFSYLAPLHQLLKVHRLSAKLYRDLSLQSDAVRRWQLYIKSS